MTAENAPRIVERLLKSYLAHRASPDETFLAFARRHEIEQLKSMVDAEAVGMTQSLPPPFATLVPDNAPFSPEQRAWLNGFFAGLVTLDGAGVTPLSPEQSAALMPSGRAQMTTTEHPGMTRPCRCRSA